MADVSALTKYIPFSSGGFGVESWSKILFWGLIYIVAIVALIYIWRKVISSIPIEIYVKSGSGHRIKKAHGTFKRIGEIDSLYIKKEREHIPLPPQSCVFLTKRFFGRGEKIMMIKDDEGGLHYMSIPDEKTGYIDEIIDPKTGEKKGTFVPYIIPESRNMKEWYKNITRVLHEKLSTKSLVEKLAPYGTFALVCIMCIIVIYMTYNKIGGG